MLLFMYLFSGIALSFSLEILENYQVFELNVLHQNVNVMCLESAIISISSFPVISLMLFSLVQLLCFLV